MTHTPHVDSQTPRTDALIEDVMRRFPGSSVSASARYYEAVHQELAPLARQLERENAELLGVQQVIHALRLALDDSGVQGAMRADVIGYFCNRVTDALAKVSA